MYDRGSTVHWIIITSLINDKYPQPPQVGGQLVQLWEVIWIHLNNSWLQELYNSNPHSCMHFRYHVGGI